MKGVETVFIVLLCIVLGVLVMLVVSGWVMGASQKTGAVFDQTDLLTCCENYNSNKCLDTTICFYDDKNSPWTISRLAGQLNINDIKEFCHCQT